MSRPTKRVKKIITHSFTGGVDELLKRLKAFAEEWTTKHNRVSADFMSLAQQLQDLFRNSAEQIGRLWANQQAIVDAQEKLDLNTLALAGMMKKLFLQFHHTAGVPREDALKMYGEDIKTCFEDAHLQISAMAEKAKKAYEEAEEAKKARSEAETAEAALLAAESAPKPTAGAPAPFVPEGATVFGG